MEIKYSVSSKVIIFLLWGLLGVFLLWLGFGVYNGIGKMSKDYEDMSNNCKETQLYGLGHKGTRIQIYDCSDKAQEQFDQ